MLRILISSLALSLFLAGCSQSPTVTPPPVHGALLYLAFEGNLHNSGSAYVPLESKDGDATFEAGHQGQAWRAVGDGRYLEAQAEGLVPDANCDIRFDFKRDEPSRRGGSTQTLLVFSSRVDSRLHHLNFNVPPQSNRFLSVNFTDTQGRKQRLTAEPVTTTQNWHRVRLNINQATTTATLYLDNTRVAQVNAIPNIAPGGFQRVKIGTWFKTNQAYLGLIDNVIVANVDME